MADTLFPITLKPGVRRNGTLHDSVGSWYFVNLIRWFEGAMRAIGGWEQVVDTANAPIALTGVCRAVIAWRGLDNVAYLGMGTESNLYVYSQGVLTDITPVDLVVGIPDTGFTTGNYGDGDYGAGVYGGASTLLQASTAATSWSLDTFGELLVGVHSTDGRPFVWTPGDPTAVPMTASSGSVPVQCGGIVVTPERFVVTLNADGYPRQVKWASQESLTDWAATSLTTAGDLDLQGTGKLMCASRGRNETLIWTENELYALRYVGGTLVYGLERLGTNCGITSSKAFATVDGNAIWMGRNSFFMYDGFVKPVPSAVSDYVFGDFNVAQRDKCWAMPISQFGEVHFFYPSAGSMECDRYVSWNYREDLWAMGKDVIRSAGVDRGAFDNPIMADPFGQVFEHEKDFDHHGEPIYAETGPVEFEAGNRYVMVRRIVPDATSLGDVSYTVFAANNPTDVERTTGPLTVKAPTDVRISGRQVRVRIDQLVEGNWRVGTTRIDAVPVGYR